MRVENEEGVTQLYKYEGDKSKYPSFLYDIEGEMYIPSCRVEGETIFHKRSTMELYSDLARTSNKALKDRLDNLPVPEGMSEQALFDYNKEKMRENAKNYAVYLEKLGKPSQATNYYRRKTGALEKGSPEWKELQSKNARERWAKRKARMLEEAQKKGTLYKGENISFDEMRKIYTVAFRHDGKSVFIGNFTTRNEAEDAAFNALLQYRPEMNYYR